MILRTLDEKGSFYRGTLHVHTTASDGERTPEETAACYKAQGYSFIAITDHNRYGIYPELNEKDFLILPGTEIDCVDEDKVHHVVGFSTPKRTKYPHGHVFSGMRTSHPQALIDELTAHGNYAIYAHPFWSYCEPETLHSLTGLTGMEIINYSCEQEWKSGISEFYYEYLRAHGSKLWCFGADDAHGHVPDYFGGYITVKAPELTHEAIMDAILRGSFYASFGREGEIAPQIYDFRVEDGVAIVECSPSRNIHLNVTRNYYEPVNGTPDHPVTHHELKLPKDARQVRAIVSDFQGLVSWTQPIMV